MDLFRRFKTVWPAAFFLLASLALNRGLLPHLTDTLPGNAGDPMLNAWILAWVSDAVGSDPASLWDAPIFHPTEKALALSEHLFGIAVFVAPVYWLTGDAILTYNVAFLLGYALLGFSTFHLTRTLTGRTDAALAAGLVVMSSPYFVSSQVARLQTLSAGWSVLTWSYLWRWLQAPSRRLLVAAAICWIVQCYSNTYIGLFLPLTIVLLAVVGHAARPSAAIAARGGALALAAFVVVLVVAPVLLLYRDVHNANGLGHSTTSVHRYSATVSSYGRVWDDRRDWPWRDDVSDRALFPGVLLTGLALAAAVSSVSRRQPPQARRATLALAGTAVVMAAISFGPTPAIVDAPLGVPGPYALLTYLVPEAESVRAPGRFAVFVILALGGLAGLGASAIFSRLGPTARWSGLAAVALLSLVTGRRDYDWLAHLADPDPSSAAAYAWLAEQPPSVILELPVVTHFQAQAPNAGASVTLRYQLAALEHGHRLVNGSSGFVTPLVALLQAPTSPFTTMDTIDEAVELMRDIGTRYVVLHRHEHGERWLPHADATIAALRADTAHVESVREFGSTVVFTLRPRPAQAPPMRRARLPNTEFTLAVSHDHGGAAHLVDADADTRWQVPQRNGAWIEVQLRRTRHLSGVKLDVAHHAVAEYPHYLRIVGRGVDGDDIVLYDGAGVLPTARAAVLEPSAPGLRVTWPSMPLSSLRIEQPVPAGDRRWTVHELHLLTDVELN